MQVNPFYLNNAVGALDTAQAQEQKLTEELSSGVSVNQLSDNPSAAGENVVLLNQIQQDDTFTQTSSLAEGQLQVTDTTLGSVVSQLNDAIALVTQGNSGTENATDLSSIAGQLTGILNEVQALGNTSYLGNYIFSGSQTATEPFTMDNSTNPATVIYNGDSNVSTLVTPNGQSIQMNLPGDQIFGSGSTGVLATLSQVISSFQAGKADPDGLTAITDSLNYVSQQRVTLDSSLTRLNAAESAVTGEETQLKSAQTNLMQADVGTISTQLSTTESQVAALSSVISQLGKSTLFNYLQ
jgi:flagellar hook-associated protein 3 FlgL